MTKYQPGTVLRLPRDESNVTYTVMNRRHPNGCWLRSSLGGKTFPINYLAVIALLEVAE